MSAGGKGLQLDCARVNCSVAVRAPRERCRSRGAGRWLEAAPAQARGFAVSLRLDDAGTPFSLAVAPSLAPHFSSVSLARLRSLASRRRCGKNRSARAPLEPALP